MAEYKLGRIRFVWKSDWITGTTYYKDDVINYGGKTFICVVGHIAAADFYTDSDNVPPKWNQFADGQSWKGDWTNETLYKVNDLVKYGGYVYLCNEGHTSSTLLEDDQSKWDIYAEGFDWKSDWAVSTIYKVNDLVKYGGNTYVCTAAHTSYNTETGGLEFNIADWDLFTEGFDWKSDWAADTRYKINDLVKYGGQLYVCNEGHTSASTTSLGLEDDQSKWDYFNKGTEYKGDWTSSTRYKINDLVKYGGSIWICVGFHTSTSSFDDVNFEVYVHGLEFEGFWNSSTVYQIGDVVRYGGYTYVAKEVNDNVVPTTTATWDLFTQAFRFIGEYDNSTAYKVGEVVTYGGYTYTVIADTTGNVPTDAEYWQQLNSGFRWRGEWLNSTDYIKGDVVKFNANSYVCVLAHTSDDDDSTITPTVNSPEKDTVGTYWNLFTGGLEESVLTSTGDLVYFSPGGPTRLEIGTEGQVLSVVNGVPAWRYWGLIDKIYYVGPNGVDSPAPSYGMSIDRPWASVRYATEQVEAGAEFSNAGYLLKQNRAFIQREIVEWTNYQIANNTAPFTSSFTYDETFCQRDMGLIIDAVIHDLTHGGNTKSIEAAQRYFTALGVSYISGQEDETIASINYGLSLIDNVLQNLAPAANYQTLMSVPVGDRIKQLIDFNYTSESNARSICSSLVGIVTDAIAAGDTDNLPNLDTPNYTINVKTGLFEEVLPIILPANTSVVGDELRSTRVSPAGKLIPTNDKNKSVQTLQRIQEIIGDVITNTSVTPTSGNTESQDTSSQIAGTGSDTGVLLSNSNIIEMKNIIENGDDVARAFVYPNPTDYNSTYLTGYGDARAQLVVNKAFIVDEITSWIAAQVAGPTAPFAGDFTYDTAACERDVGYIIDALVYDLTYGGNLQTLVAARSYFSLGTPVYGTGEKEEVIASYEHLLDVVGYVIDENTSWSKSTSLTQDTSGTAGSAGSKSFAEARVQEIIDALTADSASGVAEIAPSTTWVDAGLAAAGEKLLNAKGYIQVEAIEFINSTFPELVYDEALCSRDVGYIIEALAYDAMFGSNVMSIKAAMAYSRGLASTGIVTSTQLEPTLAIIDFAYAKAQAEFRNSTAVSSIVNNSREIKDILQNGIASANAYVRPTPTGGNYGYTSGYFNAARLVLANKAFLQAEVTAWIEYQIDNDVSPFVGFTYDQTTCERDVGYIVEGLFYDLMYGGNLATVIAARSYYSNGVLVEVGEKDQALALWTYVKSIIDDIATGNLITPTTGNGETQDNSGTAGSAGAASFAQARIQEIYDTIDTGDSPATIAPETTWVDSTLVAAKAKLDDLVTTVQSDAVQYIKREFPTLVFNETLCSRDVGYIVDALGYDMMFGSNFLSIWNGMSYRRGLTSTGVVLAEQLDATSKIIDFVGVKSSKIAAEGNVELVNLLLSDIIGYVNSGAAPIIVGTNTPTTDLSMFNTAEILLLNKEFLAAEAAAYIANTFTSSVTASTTTTFTADTTAWMVVGDKVQFNGTTFGGVSTATDYYISEVVSSTEFKISNTLGGTSIALSIATGTMTVDYTYNVDLCKKDVRLYVDAMVYDLKYTGNYKSVYAGRYYRNALTGSKLENMYYVRNAGGVRNQTLIGLDGSSDGNTTGVQDALVGPNAYGTYRPRAGAYVSLDPGWGPNDSRVWITYRSTYVQNVTTFGTGATGQKVDGSVHAQGNDSIVSNDFTQVISDGVGAWVTNLGRVELVSVFTYYSHIGYLAENGGKIRATNGNNSYGTYGSVAEGVDVTETPITGTINNRASEASIANVNTNGSQILNVEYLNAGLGYSSATYSAFGSGINFSALGNETRDGGVFQVRLTDPGDSSGTGGTGYLTTGNVAQGGNELYITLAATDTALSTAYVGMHLLIVSGTGAGQYGYIQSYNAGSKRAYVYKISDGTAGWDHLLPGTEILTELDLTTTYEITPRVEFAAPAFSTDLTTLPAGRDWKALTFGAADGTYSGIFATGGTGSAAAFDVVRRMGGYTVTLAAPGFGYAEDDELTIAGDDLGGATPDNDLTITLTNVDSVDQGVASFTISGTAIPQKIVAVASGTDQAASTEDATTWSNVTLPVSAAWSGIAYGSVSNIGYWVAVARESASAAYSTDGENWTASNLNEVADWVDVAYGNGRFVAIAESDSSVTFKAVSTNGGATWTTSTMATGAIAIAYGLGKFVTVEGNFSNTAAYSTDGGSWTTATLPSNDDSTESNWKDVAFGNNRFVAISDNGAHAAISYNGTTWSATVLPFAADWKKITYGNGVFVAMAGNNQAATSSDGINWTSRDTSAASISITSTAKDNTSGWDQFDLPSSKNWTDVDFNGTNLYVAVSSDSGATPPVFATSADGETWSSNSASTNSTDEIRTLAYGAGVWVAPYYSGNDVLTSSNGTSWTFQSNVLSANRNWSTMTYGGGYFVLFGDSSTSMNYSANGTSWTAAAVSGEEWTNVAYGGGTWVAVSGITADSDVVTYATNVASWSTSTMPSASRWSSVTYGGGQFVAVAGSAGVSTTIAAYSSDGITWNAATLPASRGWTNVSYVGGVFIATAYNSNKSAKSENGIDWEEIDMATTSNWLAGVTDTSTNNLVVVGAGAYANKIMYEANTNYLTVASTSDLSVNDVVTIGAATFGGLTAYGTYYVKEIVDATTFTVSESLGGTTVTLTSGSGTMPATIGKLYSAIEYANPTGFYGFIALGYGNAKGQTVFAGATAQGRAYVLEEKISAIWLSEPGSNYDPENPPTMTITDPNNTGADATHEVRINNGVLAQPNYTNRGTGFATATATVTGDGYADNYQTGAFIAFENLTDIPKEGSNLQIAGIDDVWYRTVSVRNLSGSGTYSATVQLSPEIGAAESPEHGTVATLRRRYSQVRLTGHDFLDIGTGGITTTNYPGLPLTDPNPANETITGGGGRVFWTSTDQDGNFRVGGLFNVEQSTGTATLNADAFNLAGLNELSLGSVALGGGGATINEFSTDPFFTADSDSVIPTQRAIKAYISSQIGGGGSSLNVNSLTAGVIYVAGQEITTTTNVQININTKVNFAAGVDGYPVVLNYFLQS